MSASRFSLMLVLLAAACGRKEAAAPPASAGKLAALVAEARNLGPCRSIIAAEWPASWAVPAGGGAQRFSIFFYPLKGAPPDDPRLASPACRPLRGDDRSARAEVSGLRD